MTRWRAILLAATLSWTSTAALADTITLLCKGDAFAPTIGGTEIGSGRVVVDTAQRIFQGLKEGTTQSAGDGDVGPQNCVVVFIVNEAIYGVTEHCEGPMNISGQWVNGILGQQWRVDRVTGRLNLDWNLGKIGFHKTADCSPMDTHPRF